MVMLRRKFHILQNFRENRLLVPRKRAIDAPRSDFKPAIGVLPVTFGSGQIALNKSIAIELESRRNAAIMYANTIPPR